MNTTTTMTTREFFDAQFGDVRCVLKNGELLWCATDVCNAIALGNAPQAISRLPKSDIMNIKELDHTNCRGGAQKRIYLTEAGLWSLVLSSRKRQAAAFKRWLTKVVLPSLRQNGGYIEGQENLEKEDLEKLKAEISALHDEVKELKKNKAEVVKKCIDKDNLLQEVLYRNATNIVDTRARFDEMDPEDLKVLGFYR